ncbi:hypothetical protein VP01_4707g1, partial [Puccinia sorghi]
KRSQSFIEKKLNQAIFFKFQEQISRHIYKQNHQLFRYFKEIQLTQADWMQIKHLNDELEFIFCDFQVYLDLNEVLGDTIFECLTLKKKVPGSFCC